MRPPRLKRRRQADSTEIECRASCRSSPKGEQARLLEELTYLNLDEIRGFCSRDSWRRSESAVQCSGTFSQCSYDRRPWDAARHLCELSRPLRRGVSLLRAAPGRQGFAVGAARGRPQSEYPAGLEGQDPARAHRHWRHHPDGRGHSDRRADAQRLLDAHVGYRIGRGALLRGADRRRRDLHEDGKDAFRQSLRDAARSVRRVLDAPPSAEVNEGPASVDGYFSASHLIAWSAMSGGTACPPSNSLHVTS